MRFTAFPLVAIATVFGVALAGPISERSSGLSCSKEIYKTENDLGYGNDITGYTREALGKHTSQGGQVQLTRLTDGAEKLNVNIRFCNSTHLGISGQTEGFSYNQKYGGYVSFGKIFLADDESKCLQRHATLPSSDPNARTHITVEDCSNVDDATQARQFWYFQTKFGQAQPITKSSDGQINTINLALSDTKPQAVLAANNGQAYQGLLF
ncbi:uncharacterized protein FA14DRAFT_155538 [Meira miltonrushii]|uniref:Uncharacterized protein n=1 Tax=Meira miltonrushii TaxID=1280837 RepID=A0A316VKT0_9BASI|nr:uncharacterized protein FA14DRAFT_155538 [Meira miltonrushii]PWN36135.1 hypothetical protein FA14DRAFT_155538 [Meira miltonrushii]